MAGSREFQGEGIRVMYDAARCIHAAECVHGLGTVFDPDRRPWIDPAAAPAEEVATVIRRCPTGALRYERLDGGPQEEPAPANRLQVAADGPIYASGDLAILDAEHAEIERHTRVALCRCGASKNKPFCDGTHVEAGFADPGKLGETRMRPHGEDDPPTLSIRLRADGPLVLEGRFRIEGADRGGADGAACALCRCGHSNNKPFCDGTHRQTGFEADDPKAG